MYNPNAIATLRDLFAQVDRLDLLESALEEECAKATLHGVVDSLYDEWDNDVDRYVTPWLETRAGGDLEFEEWEFHLHELKDLFPGVTFQWNDEWGLQVWRGRIFSLRDYQLAKEAIANMGEDRFARKFRERFERIAPTQNHLWTQH